MPRLQEQLAWQYLDRGLTEYLRSEDAAVLLHNLGQSLSHAEVPLSHTHSHTHSLSLSHTHTHTHTHTTSDRASATPRSSNLIFVY